MCYLIAKKINDIGCLALQTAHGQHLVDFKRKLIAEIGTDKVQLVTISRPSAYWYDTSKVDRLNIKICCFGGIFHAKINIHTRI